MDYKTTMRFLGHYLFFLFFFSFLFFFQLEKNILKKVFLINYISTYLFIFTHELFLLYDFDFLLIFQ